MAPKRILGSDPGFPDSTGVCQKMKRRLRQIHSLIFGILLSTRLSMEILAFLNRRFRFLHTVFVAYPAEESYALAYIPPSKRHLMLWKPWPVGFFRQGRKWGLTFVISSAESDFAKTENLPRLKRLLHETESICRRLGAEQTCFSGILPGVFYARRLRKNFVEADVTVRTLVEVEKMLRAKKELPDDVPIIVLGGKGFIGRRFFARHWAAELFDQLTSMTRFPSNSLEKPRSSSISAARPR